MTISNILAHLIGLTGNVTDAFTTALFVVDPRNKTLVLREHLSLSASFDPRVKIPIDRGPLGQVVQNMQPKVVDHFDPDLSQLPYYREEEPIKSLLAVPVIFKDLEGVLVVDTRKTYSFSPKIQKIVRDFSDQMAWHLHHERKSPRGIDVEQPAIREIHAFNRYIVESPDREAVAERLIQIPPSILEADAVAAIWFDGQDSAGRIQCQRGFRQGLSELGVLPGQGIAGQCAKNRIPVLIQSDDRNRTALFNEHEEPELFESVAAAPITFNEHLLGVLLVARRNAYSLSQPDLDKLSLIASSAASALFCADTKSRWDYSKKKDLITGVPNHHFLTDHHASIAEKVFKEGGPVFFLTVQISNLPSLYESYGIRTGNMLLRQISSMFTKVVPSPKLIFKYSDTTFLIIMMKKNREEVSQLESKLRQLFDKNSLYVDRKSLTVQTEWGMSIYPEDGGGLLRLIGLSWARISQHARAAS